MFEVEGKVDHEAIMRQAHAMRAQVFADMMKSFVALFRRNTAAKPARA